MPPNNQVVAPADATAGPSRLLSSLAVLLAVLMVILDMTIVNVALPDMMGTLERRPTRSPGF
ncbi:hypothetical protein [Bradyrhizobium sp. RDI18]|uniref:hypothetical protein n=1 Tax=Bradyrhizobium sp. RDI18 TaxID=3367400 RepID=UPI00370FA8DC